MWEPTLVLENNYKPVKVSANASKMIKFEGIFFPVDKQCICSINFDNAHGWTISACLST